MRPLLLSQLSLALLVACPGAVAAPHVEHGELEATLYAPFHGETPGAVQPEARTFTLTFDYPGLARARIVDWRLELTASSGKAVRRWHGARRLASGAATVAVRWDGRGAVPGLYQVTLRASLRGSTGTHDSVEQAWQIAVGQLPAPPMPRFDPLPGSSAPPLQAAPAAGALPYTIYFGNLHSQSNHSDGGAELAGCNGSQNPQAGRYGPDDAFDYARKRGLDMLVVSEHNHMYDGSDGSNPDADAGKAKAMYQAGLATAAKQNAAHPGFLAVYGLEWGVIGNGGHLNIFNSPELLGWETNARGELVADTLTPRSDYATLYTLMKKRGWIGQFNHPSYRDQFKVNGAPLAYTRDGDEVMALCEVLNSTAFSTNDSETETRRSNFETACNKLLEAGYHVAFSSNQDNHCANWGASYTNRTGVLIRSGTRLSPASFIEALRARRVFATMDKGSQLVLTANGRLMGERFANSGPLKLVANFASAAGKAVASVAIMQGVPGRNGKVTQLASTAVTTILPAPGEHFYYAKVTQADGNVLWSAPVWVTQAERKFGG
jgi:hypothetical protein